MIGRYRVEIDGLRAIAVCFVILFHFFPNLFPIGYLGVDLFFVISGYVITTQLQAKMRDSSFSFANFYTRRIKRILPLTFLVLAVTVSFGSVILLKADFARLIDSAFATATFWANIFFWRDGGYFGDADKLKPLLHMWSLAVEEQFYIVFPAIFWFLIACLKMRPVPLVVSVMVLALLSLGGYLGLNYIGGGSPAFFMMPTRAWQFGFGALAALIVADGWRRDRAILSALSLAAVLACFFITASRFPGEIIITFAAVTYLVTTRGAFIADSLLSKKWMVYLGLRSFSLYLWHWPIVAFLGYVFVEDIPLVWKIAGLTLTLLFSEISYWLVEKPFRYHFTLRASIGFIASCCVLVIGMNIFSIARSPDSLSERFAAQTQTNYRCALSDFIAYGASRACIIRENAPQGNVAILGNSHAQMYTEAIGDIYNGTPVGLVLVPLNGCLPTTRLNISTNCAEDALINLNLVLADNSISTVFIGTTYGHDVLVQTDGTIVEDPQGLQFADALIDLVDRLEGNQKTVYLMGPIQVPGFDLPGELSRRLRFGGISEIEVRQALELPRNIFDERFSSTIDALSERLGPNFLRPDTKLCDPEICFLGDANGSFFADSNHLGHHGINTIQPIFDMVQASSVE